MPRVSAARTVFYQPRNVTAFEAGVAEVVVEVKGDVPQVVEASEAARVDERGQRGVGIVERGVQPVGLLADQALKIGAGAAGALDQRGDIALGPGRGGKRLGAEVWLEWLWSRQEAPGAPWRSMFSAKLSCTLKVPATSRQPRS